MTSRNLIRFTLLTVVSIAVWMLANFRMRGDSELRSTLLHVVYPVAVLAGAAALTGLAQRTRPLLSRTGAVSVLRFGGAAGLVIVGCVVGVVLGDGVFQLLCWYVALTSALALVFVLLMRGGTQHT